MQPRLIVVAVAAAALAAAPAAPARAADEPALAASCVPAAVENSDSYTVLHLVVRARALGGYAPGLANATCTVVAPDGTQPGAVSTLFPSPEAIGAGAVVVYGTGHSVCLRADGMWISDYTWLDKDFGCAAIAGG